MNQAGPGPMWEIIAGMLICFGVCFLIGLTIQILFLLNLHRTLAEVREENREMSPGLVWLSLIPLFSTVWNVIIVTKIGNSLANEFRTRGWGTENEGFARVSGMCWAWGGVVSLGLSVVQYGTQFAGMPEVAAVANLVGLPVGLGILVTFIIYWVQTHGYKVQLRDGGRGYQPGGVEEDYDDRQRPRYDEDDYNDYEDRPRN